MIGSVLPSPPLQSEIAKPTWLATVNRTRPVLPELPRSKPRRQAWASGFSPRDDSVLPKTSPQAAREASLRIRLAARNRFYPTARCCRFQEARSRIQPEGPQLSFTCAATFGRLLEALTPLTGLHAPRFYPTRRRPAREASFPIQFSRDGLGFTLAVSLN